MNELLTCEGLTKSYQKGTNALDNIELHIGFGRIVGLLGPNGSGKTTLIKLANGLLQPTAGSIKIAGMDPGPDTKAIVSYLPDAAWLPDWMRVEQLVEMFRDFYADFDLSLIHISEPTRRVVISYAVFCLKKFFLMIRRPPRSTRVRSSAASDVYKRQAQ